MKVLMFGWEFPPFISGGLGTACLGLTQGLANHNIEVTFVLPKLPENAESSHVRLLGANRADLTGIENSVEELKHYIKLLEVDTLLRPYMDPEEYARSKELIDSTKKKKVSSSTYMISKDFSGEYGPDLMSEIIRYGMIGGHIASQEDFDIIHAHDWMTILAGVEAKKATGKPLVLHAHALEYDRSGENVNQEIFDLEKFGMQQADVIIAVSHYTRDIISRVYGIDADKIKVVHNAVSKERIIERRHIVKAVDEKIVLFLGRITFQKGPDYFLEAARKVIDKIPDVRFVMAGTGDMFRPMVERMAEMRLGRYFHFTGFLKGADVEKMFALSDLYVMPSVSEPFGIAPLEAILYDVPVIVSKQSGVAEVLDHAIKVDFWDTDVLASQIIAVLSQPALAEKLIEANSKQLANIKWEIAAEKVIGIYNAALGGNN